jgi:hypothetical protein
MSVILLDEGGGGYFFVTLDAVKNFDGYVLLATCLSSLFYIKRSQLLKPLHIIIFSLIMCQPAQGKYAIN